VSGPTFIRLLARLTDVDVPPSQPVASEQLSHWIDWTRAVALSRALDGAPAAPSPPSGPASADEEDCERTRAALLQAITDEPVLAAAWQRDVAAGDEPAEVQAQADFAIYRERHLSLQRGMLTATGRLRGRLRDRLAAQSSEMARLAEIDAVMEQTLSPREQRLLAAVPALLGEHFSRLREAAGAAAADSPPVPDPAAQSAGHWLDTFRQDMRNVLLAELEVRFQPVQGLLAALRTR